MSVLMMIWYRALIEANTFAMMWPIMCVMMTDDDWYWYVCNDDIIDFYQIILWHDMTHWYRLLGVVMMTIIDGSDDDY